LTEKKKKLMIPKAAAAHDTFRWMMQFFTLLFTFQLTFDLKDEKDGTKHTVLETTMS